MDEDIEAPEGFLRRAWRWLQWAVAIVLGLMALMFATGSLNELRSPGAPVAFFWVATALFAGVALAHAPPAFFRLPRWGKLGVYLAILPAIAIEGTALQGLSEAYGRTPEGAKEAELRRKDEAAEARIATAERNEAEAAKAAEAIADMKDGVEDCISSWSGGIPALKDDVKGSLHNPDAFEHVETRVIGPTPDDDNVEMSFRAENGFGAIRTGWVRAKIDPDTCEVVSRGPLNVD